jgi:hypothetical protein
MSRYSVSAAFGQTWPRDSSKSKGVAVQYWLGLGRKSAMCRYVVQFEGQVVTVSRYSRKVMHKTLPEVPEIKSPKIPNRFWANSTSSQSWARRSTSRGRAAFLGLGLAALRPCGGGIPPCIRTHVSPTCVGQKASAVPARVSRTICLDLGGGWGFSITRDVDFSVPQVGGN